MSTIGTRVRELRQRKGLSQQALAGDGVSAGYVSLIESGKRVPSTATVERLARRLGVQVDELLVDDRPLAADRAHIDANFARLALSNGQPAEAVRALSKVPLKDLDSRTAGETYLVLAEALQETGELDEAVSVLESLMERCRREGSWVILACAATSLTAMYVESGDVSRAVETSQRAVREVEAAGLQGTDEHLRLGAAQVSALLERGDLLFASHYAGQLIEVADRLGSARARGSVYWNAAVAAHERGRFADAIRLTDRAVALIGEQDGGLDLPRLRLHYAWLLLNQAIPAPQEALEQLDRAERDPVVSGSKLDLGTAATFRACAHLLLGDVDSAAEQAAQALQLLGPSEHIERASALVVLGDVGVAQDDDDLADESYREAQKVLSRMTPSRRVARLWRELGDAFRDHGDLTRSVEAFNRSLKMMGLSPRPTPARTKASHAGIDEVYVAAN
jgi:tetratricopeptide (TPR) repeat protein